MAGVFVRLLSVPLVIIMLTALVTVHLRFGFSSIRLKAVTEAGPQFGPVGYELSLLYSACLIVLATSGPTAWSLARLWEPRPGSKPRRAAVD